MTYDDFIHALTTDGFSDGMTFSQACRAIEVLACRFESNHCTDAANTIQSLRVALALRKAQTFMATRNAGCLSKINAASVMMRGASLASESTCANLDRARQTIAAEYGI